MKLKTVDDLLNFNGDVPARILRESEQDLLSECAQLVAFHRAQSLLAQIEPELEPARVAVAAAAVAADETETEAKRLFVDVQKMSKPDNELRVQYESAVRAARESLTASDAASRRAQGLRWLQDSLATIQRPEFDSLTLLIREVNGK